VSQHFNHTSVNPSLWIESPSSITSPKLIIDLIDKNFLFVERSIRNAVLYVKKILATKYGARIAFVMDGKEAYPTKLLHAALQEVFHKADRPETVNSAVAPFNR